MHKKLLAVIILASILAACMFISCSGQGEPPEGMISINGEEKKLAKGSYQWTTRYMLSSQTVGTDAASPNQMAEYIKAIQIEKQTIAAVVFKDGSKPVLHAYIWKQNERSAELATKDNQLVLPTEKGKHVIEITAKWPKGNASYTFVAEVK